MRAERFGADQQVAYSLVKRFPGSSHNFVSWLMLGGGTKDGRAAGHTDVTPAKMVKAMSAYKRLNELVKLGALVKRGGAAYVVPGTSNDGYWVTRASGSIADGVVAVSGSDAHQGVDRDSAAAVEVRQGVASAESTARNISDLMGELG